MRDFLEDEDRLLRVGQMLLVAGANLCQGATRHSTGLVFTSAAEFGLELAGEVQRQIGLSGSQVGVLHVAAGSPAMAAGMRRGDRVRSFNGLSLGEGGAGLTALQDEAERAARRPDPVLIEFERRVPASPGGTVQTLRALIVPQLSCDLDIRLNVDEQFNAFTDGQRITVYRGLLHKVSDTELAYALAHEIAHNVLQHPALMQRRAAGSALAQAIASGRGVRQAGTPLSRELQLEIDADRMGLYIAARAGVPLGAALGFWSRLTDLGDASGSGPGHVRAQTPYAPARLQGIAQSVAEIQRKQQQGEPLVPDLPH